ncbi:MAG: hypothetical protein A4E51_01859 [Methanosaeta sp. PtaU1.Bin055]|nr:MAG: hypothetical protein A4E51_01859 [Methanosaeta sp. PtaU1.Bin055]
MGRRPNPGADPGVRDAMMKLCGYFGIMRAVGVTGEKLGQVGICRRRMDVDD